MRFVTTLVDLNKAIQQVIPAVAAKSTLPILEHCHLSLVGDTLSLMSTDQELVITTSTQVTTKEEGEILVPARRFGEVVKALGSEGTIEVIVDLSSMTITLKTSHGKYQMRGLPTSDFPSAPVFSSSARAKLPASVLSRIAHKVAFAVSKEEYRPAMTGVLFDITRKSGVVSMVAVATDGYRLARIVIQPGEGIELPDPIMVIIPSRVIDLMKRVDGEVSIILSKTHAEFAFDSTRIITRLIDEKFPPYENVIPSDHDKQAEFDQREIVSAIKRVSLFASSVNKQVTMRIGDGTMTLSSKDEDTGSDANESIACTYTGADTTIGFNYQFLEEALQMMGGEESGSTLKFSFSNPTKATLLRPIESADDLLILVMPIRLPV